MLIWNFNSKIREDFKIGIIPSLAFGSLGEHFQCDISPSEPKASEGAVSIYMDWEVDRLVRRCRNFNKVEIVYMISDKIK